MRIIDADAVIAKLDEQIQMPTFMDCLSAINSAPSIDIVFCKECKHYKILEAVYDCEMSLTNVAINDFCSYGERREP